MTPDLLSRISTINASYSQLSPVSDDCQIQQSQETASPVVGQILSAEVRRAAIERAGCAMESAYNRFKQTQNPADLDLAHYHMQQMLFLAGIPYERSEA